MGTMLVAGDEFDPIQAVYAGHTKFAQQSKKRLTDQGKVRQNNA
jgi:hypothetical protein